MDNLFLEDSLLVKVYLAGVFTGIALTIAAFRAVNKMMRRPSWRPPWSKRPPK